MNPKKTSTWAWRKARAISSCGSFFRSNKAPFLVALSQLFATFMNVAARLLEREAGLHPLQVLFIRMLLTAILCTIYMYWTKTPQFPLGHPDMRWLLVARGVFGFFGIYGLWSSLMYLDLAEATVLTFLAPSVIGYICHILLHERFTGAEQLASVVAFLGVVVIARPTSLFSNLDGNVDDIPPAIASVQEAVIQEANSQVGEDVTPTQRLLAVGMGMIGVAGTSGAITSIRWIGTRAHPLISVNYFSVLCTIVSGTVLAVAPMLGVAQPGVSFALPQGLKQWGLLWFLGTCGFVMQFLFTSGLGAEKSNRATMAMYIQMVYAAAFDRLIFGLSMGWSTILGCVMIVGSAIWATLTKDQGGTMTERSRERELRDPERAALLGGEIIDEASGYGSGASSK